MARSSISANAFVRLMALQEAELNAADRLRVADNYPDYFVEGSGPPWHEYFPDVVHGEAVQQFSEDRMVRIDAIRSGDGYSDFFVEGGGPPWHEAFEDFITGRNELGEQVVRGGVLVGNNAGARVRAMRQLNVMRAYQQIRRENETR